MSDLVPLNSLPPELADIKLKPCYLSLVQGVTRNKMGAHPGQLLDSTTGEKHDSMHVVVLAESPKRALFPKELSLKEPICRSNDGIVPAANAKAPQAHTCASCKYGQWYNGNAPACNLNHELFVVDRESDFPYYLTLSGRSVTSWKHFKQNIIDRDRAIRYRKTGGIFTLVDYTFTISAEEIPSNLGMTFVTKFTGQGFLGDEAAKYRGLQARYLSRTQQEEQAEQEQAVDDAIDAEIVPQEV